MITFNFKKQKNTKEEKYNFPVVTQVAYTGKKGSVAKFEFNKAALFALGYNPDELKNSKISVGMIDNMLVIVNTTGMETEHQYNITLQGAVNSKVLLNQLSKRFEICVEETNEFKLIVNETPEGMKYANFDINLEDTFEPELTAIGEPVEIEEKESMYKYDEEFDRFL